MKACHSLEACCGWLIPPSELCKEILEQQMLKFTLLAISESSVYMNLCEIQRRQILAAGYLKIETEPTFRCSDNWNVCDCSFNYIIFVIGNF